MRDEELFKNKTDQMIDDFIERCEREASKLEITVDYYIKEFVLDFDVKDCCLSLVNQL